MKNVLNYVTLPFVPGLSFQMTVLVFLPLYCSVPLITDGDLLNGVSDLPLIPLNRCLCRSAESTEYRLFRPLIEKKQTRISGISIE